MFVCLFPRWILGLLVTWLICSHMITIGQSNSFHGDVIWDKV